MLLALLACHDVPADDSAAPQATSFRVAVVSDTHVIGPQYTCCSENGDLDNSSIMKTVERLEATVAALNAVEPAPDLVFLSGDIVHDARVFPTLAEYQGQDTAWSRAAALLGQLEMPWYVAWGNHDYDFSCDDPSYDRQLTHDLFATFLGQTPTTVVDHEGWRFLLANSQLGPTFDLADARCDGGTGSFGHDQLGWLHDQLAEGLPTIVFSHHYLPVIERDEDPDGWGDFEAVLSGAPDVKLAIAGHAHRWLDFDASYPFRQVLLGGTRYDTDNFWILELPKDGSGYTILDEDKAEWFTTCAETWVYDGEPAPDPDHPEETGDCGS